MYYLNPTMRRHQNKLKLKDILQRLIRNIFKNVNVMKEKEKLRNCSRLKVTKERCPTSLVVRWLRLQAPTTGGEGSIPGWGI